MGLGRFRHHFIILCDDLRRALGAICDSVGRSHVGHLIIIKSACFSGTLLIKHGDTSLSERLVLIKTLILTGVSRTQMARFHSNDYSLRGVVDDFGEDIRMELLCLDDELGTRGVVVMARHTHWCQCCCCCCHHQNIPFRE